MLWYFPTQLTPQRRVLLEKLIVSQMIKKFLAFYGTQTFIALCTNARNWNLHWTHRIQSTDKGYFNFCTVSDLRLRVQNGIFPSSLPAFCAYFSQLKSVPLPNLFDRFTHVFSAPSNYNTRHHILNWKPDIFRHQIIILMGVRSTLVKLLKICLNTIHTYS